MATVPDLDEIVTIVNGTKTYRVSKEKLSSSMEYFKKMFSGDLSEAKKGEIETDFFGTSFAFFMNLDEKSFDVIMDYILTGYLTINMENVLQLQTTAHYLGMEQVDDTCTGFFIDHFKIDQLPSLFEFLEKCPDKFKLFSKGIMDCFIKRQFARISLTKSFLDYPIKLIEYICRLDLEIDSEYQVFTAIIRWIKFAENERKVYIQQLMKCVNWCHMHSNDLDSVKTDSFICQFPNLMNILCSSDECKNACTDRLSGKFLTAIFELDKDTIEIRKQDKAGHWSTWNKFQRDQTISTSLLVGEHIIDIIFNSDRTGIRVDCNTGKFNYLQMSDYKYSYYKQVKKCITSDSDLFSLGIDNHNEKESKQIVDDIYNEFLEYGKYYAPIIVIHCKNTAEWSKNLAWQNDKYFECLILDTHYLLRRNFSLTRMERGSPEVEKMSCIADDELSFDDLELFSHDYKLYLCDKRWKSLYVFDNEQWKIACQIAAYKRLIAMGSFRLPDWEIVASN